MSQSEAKRIGPLSLSDLLEGGLSLNPDGIALVSAGKEMSWRELELAAGGYAAGLLAMGLKRGDRIASLMPNCAELVIHYLGCFKSGIIAVPLNYRYTPPEIDHGLAASGARALLAHVDRQQDLSTTVAARVLSLRIIEHGGEPTHPSSFEFLVKRYPCNHITAPVLADPADIFFTSGSTGPAKGVTHSFASLGSMIANYARACETTEADIVLLPGSMSHIGAFLDAFMALSVGARIVIAKSFDGDALLHMLRQYRPTFLVALPVTLFGLVRTHEVVAADLASLRYIGAGGDKVPRELELEVAALTGLSVIEQYGMSEIGIATINPPDGSNSNGSIGQAIVSYEMSIRNDEGKELTPGLQGRLWVKSPCNMIGYWGDPHATAEVMQDGWFDTGDMMTIDDTGYFWFGGRRKQIIVHDGSNISPQEVEEALMQHPAVELAGVVGVPDLIHGEKVHAFISFKKGVPRHTCEELIEFARARVGYKAPKDVSILDHMPLNAADKVDRVALKKMVVGR